MSRRRLPGLLGMVLVLSMAVGADAATQVSVLEHEADSSGEKLSTEAIQAAIDAVHRADGGQVVVPEGTYRVTTVALKDGVELHLAEGARLQASRKQEDYQQSRAVVFAHEATDIAVTGQGRIHGAGTRFYGDQRHPIDGNHPSHIVNFINCQDVKVTGLRLLDPVAWTVKLVNCEQIHIDAVTIRTPTHAEHAWTDGIDLVSSRHAVVENCDVESGDDGICIKTQVRTDMVEGHPPAYDIRVRDCTIATTCNATKIGTGTLGDVRDVVFENITVKRHSQAKAHTGNPIASGAPISAIALESNDGATVQDVTCRNYTVQEVYSPIFLLLQDRDDRHASPLGTLRDLTIADVTVEHAEEASQLQAGHGGKLRRITLKNLDVRSVKKKPHFTTRQLHAMNKLPDAPDGRYPDADHYGQMPCYGLYARNVVGLNFAGSITFEDAGGTADPVVVLRDVAELDTSAVTQTNAARLK
jgi:polygalacturonase